MTKPNEIRLGIFFGVLILFATLFSIVSRIANIDMITLAPAYMFTPLVAGCTVCLIHGIPLSNVGLRVGMARWLVLSALVAPLLVGIILVLSLTVPNLGFDPAADPGLGIEFPAGMIGIVMAFALMLILGTTINAFFAFGEEFGWRGYLLWELAPLGFWRASGVIGAAWGIWHTPMILDGYNYPSFPIIGVGMMTVACIAFSPVYTYLVIRAESVFAAALLHGVFNGSAGMILVYTITDSIILAELVANPVGVAGVVAFGLAAVGIAWRGTPTLDWTFTNGNGGTEETDGFLKKQVTHNGGYSMSQQPGVDGMTRIGIEATLLRSGL